MELKRELIIPESREVRYDSVHYHGVVTDLRVEGEYNGYPILKGYFKGTSTARIFHVSKTDPCEKPFTMYGIRQWELDRGFIQDCSCG